MDPFTAVSLSGTCLSLVTKLASTAKALHSIVIALQDANQTIGHLAQQLDLMEMVFRRLQQCIEGHANLAAHEKAKLYSAILSCDVIVSHVLEHVERVQAAPGETSSSLAQKVRLLWNNEQVQERIAMINTNLQLFQTFLMALQMSVGGGRSRMMETAQSLIDKAASDAMTIRRTAEDGATLATTFLDDGKALEIRYEVDDELFKTDIYRRAIMATLRRQREEDNKLPAEGAHTSNGPNYSAPVLPPSRRISWPNFIRVKRRLSTLSRALSHLTPSTQDDADQALKALDAFCLDIKHGKTSVFPTQPDFDINGYWTAMGCTPLATAIFHRRLHVVQYLLQNGADTSLGYRKEFNWGEDWATKYFMCSACPALQLAATLGYVEAVTLLVGHGADLEETDCVDCDGRNTSASFCANKNTMPLLLSLGGRRILRQNSETFRRSR